MREGNPEQNEWQEPAGGARDGYEPLYRLACEAERDGIASQAAALFLSAFETACQEYGAPLPQNHPAVDGMRRAWNLACQMEDQHLAESIDERLRPYQSQTDQLRHAHKMEQFALGRLKELGAAPREAEVPQTKPKRVTPESLGKELVEHLAQMGIEATEVVAIPHGEAPEKSEEPEREEERLTFDNLVGFETTIMELRQHGIGLAGDPEFDEFVAKLNRHHGINGLPAFDTLLFRAPNREDASRMVQATAGQLNLPTMRVRMEATEQGAAILCIMASPDIRNKFGSAFSDPRQKSVLVLEDVDLWGLELDGMDEEENGSGMSRAAQKAIALIRASIENPNVTVLAHAENGLPLGSFMSELLAPITTVEMSNPTFAERSRLWSVLVHEHDSLARLDVTKLVHASANLSRFDIVMCVREAIEQAYRDSILKREYVRVTKDNIYEKLAACQPLDSREYQLLEDAIVSDFAKDLDKLDTYRGKGLIG